MTQRVTCPHCGKQFAARPDLLGRRVRCSGCGEPFTAEVTEELLLAPPHPPPVPALAPARAAAGIAVAAAPPTAWRPTAPTRESEQKQVAAQAVAFRIGRHLLVYGVLVLLLPLVGLQVRWVRDSGAVPWVASAVLLTLGATLCALAKTATGGRLLVQAGRWGTLVVRVVAVGCLLLLALTLAFIYVVSRGSGANRAGSDAARPPSAAPPQSESRPGFRNPAGAGFDRQGNPVGGLAWMAQRYGADKVVSVHVTAASADVREQTGILKKIMATLRDSAGAKSVSCGYSNAAGHAEGAPVNDLDALARALPVDPGAVKVDRAARIITVNLSGGRAGR